MDKNDKTSKRAVVAAAGTAVCLLVASGVGYRVLEWHLDAAGGGVPLPPGALQRLPMQIDDWVGQDVKLDDAVVKATDTDAHINRRY